MIFFLQNFLLRLTLWLDGVWVAISLLAISRGLIKTKKLQLIDTTYQFIQSPSNPYAMLEDQFAIFVERYKNDASRLMSRFKRLMVQGDSKDTAILDMLSGDTVSMEHALYWLTFLHDFSCDEIDFSHFPEVLLYYGKQDVIVPYQQMQLFQKALPDAKHVLLEDAGHVPHCHGLNDV